MSKGKEIIAINLDTSSDNNNTSEEIDYDYLKYRGPPKSLQKWYSYLSDEYKDRGGNESNAKPSFSDISKAKTCILAKAQASDASSKALVQASGSKAKVQVFGSKAKIQASMAKAFGSKAHASPKTLIVKSHVPIINCVIGLAIAQTWDAILSKTFGVKIPPTITCAKEKKGKRKIVEIIDLSSNNSDYSKCVPKEGPSVASVPEEGPSIQGLLDWYGYNTVEEYLLDTYFPSTDKDNTDKDSTNEDTIYEANSPMSKDEILKKMRVRKPQICANKAKGKRKESNLMLTNCSLQLAFAACICILHLQVASKNLQLAIVACICSLHFHLQFASKQLQLAFASKQLQLQLQLAFVAFNCSLHLHLAFAACICIVHLHRAFAACICKQAIAACNCSLHLHLAFASKQLHL
ncbi:hypothetical protein Tco_0685146, partial [Tanacetum coccineum]